MGSNELPETSLKDYQKNEDLLGEDGIIKQLTKTLVEYCWEAKITIRSALTFKSEEKMS